VGTDKFRQAYVNNKITKWVEDIEQLADLALEEPQVAHAAFTKGILHRWTNLMRTVPDIGPLFEKLETVITNKLIQALVERPVFPSKDVFLSCQYDMVVGNYQSNNHFR